MTGYREHLTDLVDKESRLHVVLGDSDIPLQLSEVLYVPGMKRNLVFVSALRIKATRLPSLKEKFLHGKRTHTWILPG
jgi:hypothetical protein